MPDPTNPDVYTHGHHESVLRCHRWRTAENSAAYLLPHLREDAVVLDVGCGPGHDHRRPRRAGAAGPGGRHRPRRRGRRRRPRRRSPPSGRDERRASPSATCTRSTPTTTASTWSTPTRCSSTSPTRWPRCARCGRVLPARRPRGRARQRLRRLHLVAATIPVLDGWLELYRAGHPGQRRRGRRRPSPARLGPGGRASRSSPSTSLDWCFADARRRAPGGAGCGPTGWWPAPCRAGASSTGSRPPASSPGWPTPGGRGPPAATRGSACCTARCWPAPPEVLAGHCSAAGRPAHRHQPGLSRGRLRPSAAGSPRPGGRGRPSRRRRGRRRVPRCAPAGRAPRPPAAPSARWRAAAGRR